MDNTQQLPAELDLEIIWDEHSALIGDDIDDLSYWSGREVMKKEDFVKSISPIAYKLHFAQQDIAQLKQWKAEASELLNPILDYGQSEEAGIPLGESITATVLERCKRFHVAQQEIESLTNQLKDHASVSNENMKLLRQENEKARTLLSKVYDDFIGSTEMSENKTDRKLFKQIKQFLDGTK